MPIPTGTKAPDFTLKTKNADGVHDVTLSSNVGRKNTLLLFFPLAFTGVCTQELCDVTSGLNAYQKLDAEVYGISVDSPFSQEEGKRILELVEAKLATSPLFSPQMHHSIFICNARWRRIALFNRQYRVGGVNYYPLTSNVFLRDALIGENRLISPSGKFLEPRKAICSTK